MIGTFTGAKNNLFLKPLIR